MYILGINISHHASLALLKDGEMIYYLEDDRWSRKKEAPWKLNSLIKSIFDIQKYTKHLDHIIFTSYCKGYNYEVDFYDEPSDAQLMEEVKKQLKQSGISFDNEYYFLEHHLYHACSAFYGSGFEEAAALVLDGGGAYIRDYIECRESESMYYFSETGKYKLISQIYTPNNIAKFDKPLKIEDNKWISSTSSCGGLFNHSSCLTQLHTPGKLMGISPHGNIDEIKDDEWFYHDNETDRWYTGNKNVLNTIRRLYNNDKMHPHYWETFENTKPIFQVNADIAKKTQYETKKHTIRLIELLLSKVETKNVVLSGGYFLNCVNNYEYVKAFPHINFYIDPLAHDGGTAHGGAKYVWHHLLNQKAKYPLKSLFLGG